MFLVDGQSLFVDGFLLFARNLEVADGTLQFVARGFELLLERGDRERPSRGFVGRPDLRSLFGSSTKQINSSSSPSLGTGCDRRC